MNGEVLDNKPSETVNTKFTAPELLATGVSVTVQFGAVPENAIPPSGSSEASDVEADIADVQLIGLSTSEIVKFTPIEESSFVV